MIRFISALLFALTLCSAQAQTTVAWLTNATGLSSLPPTSSRQAVSVGNESSGWSQWNWNATSTASTNSTIVAYTGLATGRWIQSPITGSASGLLTTGNATAALGVANKQMVDAVGTIVTNNAGLSLAKASNLSDLASAATARTNLGLGTLATQSGIFSGTSSGVNTGDQTSVSGNAGTATALQTPRAINGVSFDGTAAITVTAAAGTLTGSTLASGVTGSSLVSGAGGTFGTAAYIAAATKLDTTNGVAVNLTVSTKATIDGITIGGGPSGAAGSMRVGKNAMGESSTGTGNTVIGEGAGQSLTSGISNTLLGNNAAPYLTSSGQNVVVGKDALFYATFGDTIPGTYGYTNGVHNQIVIGANALYYLTKGRNNFAAGTFSQYNVTNGSFNVSLGTHSMNDLLVGDSNTGLGESTLWKLVSGSNNTAVGKDAGYYSTGSSSGNVYIGNTAGPTSLTTENNKLYINNGSGTPLIGGDFANDYVTITGQLFQTGNLIVTNGDISSYGSIFLKSAGYTNSPHFYTHQDGGIAVQYGGPGYYSYATFGTNGVFTPYNLASSTDLTVPGASYLNSVTATGRITSTVATGNPPFVVASTTLVTNLNAQLFGGVAASGYQLANQYLTNLASAGTTGSGTFARSVSPSFSGTLGHTGNLVVASGNIYDYGDFYLGNGTYTNTVNFYQHQDGGLAMRTGGAGYYTYHTLGTNGTATFQNLASGSNLSVPGGTTLNTLTSASSSLGAASATSLSVTGTGTIQTQLLLTNSSSGGVLLYQSAGGGFNIAANYLGAAKYFQFSGANGSLIVPGAVTGTTITSTVATGTAPLVVASTTRIPNLNADLIDGLQKTGIQPANANLTNVAALTVQSLPSTIISVTENTQVGTTYTVASTDNGKVVTLNNASAITVTVQTLSAGFSCTFIQKGAGQVTFTTSGTTVSNAHSQTKTFGQYAVVTLYGLSSTTFVLAGDTGS